MVIMVRVTICDACTFKHCLKEGISGISPQHVRVLKALPAKIPCSIQCLKGEELCPQILYGHPVQVGILKRDLEQVKHQL